MRYNIRENFFSRENGKRLFIMLGITVIVLIWSYVFLSIYNSDWRWMEDVFHQVNKPQDFMFVVGIILVCIGMSAVLGAIIYLNVTKWMRSFLVQCFFCLFGWLPFIRRYDPNVAVEKEKREFSRYMVEVENKLNRRNPYKYVEERTNAFGQKVEVHVTDYMQQSADAYDLVDTVFFIIRRFLLGIVYFLGAIGIPFCSPIIVLFGIAGISSLVKENGLYMMLIGLLMCAIVVLAYIIIPIVSFKRKINDQ